MKAQELRIGNLVNVPNKEQSPFRIDYFDENKVYQNQGFYNTEFGLVPYHPLTWDISDCAPIPLTPEILKKCGFYQLPHRTIQNSWMFNLSRDRVLSVACVGTPNEMVFLTEEVPPEVKSIIVLRNFDYDGKTHLHQLQNLYYALTGEELNFKP